MNEFMIKVIYSLGTYLICIPSFTILILNNHPFASIVPILFVLSAKTKNTNYEV